MRHRFRHAATESVVVYRCSKPADRGYNKLTDQGGKKTRHIYIDQQRLGPNGQIKKKPNHHRLLHLGVSSMFFNSTFLLASYKTEKKREIEKKLLPDLAC